jgi:hypothetical protein
VPAELRPLRDVFDQIHCEVRRHPEQVAPVRRYCLRSVTASARKRSGRALAAPMPHNSQGKLVWVLLTPCLPAASVSLLAAALEDQAFDFIERIGAGEEDRTLDIHLGKVALYR